MAIAVGAIFARPASASAGLSPLSRDALDYLKTRGILPLWIGETRPIPPWDLQAALEIAHASTDQSALTAADLETLQWFRSDSSPAVILEGATAAPFGVLRSHGMLSESAAASEWAVGWAVDSYATELRAKTGSMDLRAGRLTLGWGPGPAGAGLLFGESAGGFDALQLSFIWHRVRFTKVVGWFDAGRSIIGTRMDIPYRPNLRLGFSESVLMDGAPYLPYAVNPVPIGLNPYLWKLLRQPEGIDDNFFLGFDWDWIPRRGLRLFGELLIDDFTVPTPTANFPSRWGLTLGFHSVSDRGSGLQVMYTIVPNWTYSATNPALHYLLRNLPVGPVLGDDFDLIHVRWMPSHPPSTAWWASYIRKGEGMVGRIWIDEAEARQYTFLRGVVEYSLVAGVDVPYTIGGLSGTVGPWVAYRSNADHIAGTSRLDWGISLSVTAAY